MTNKETHIGNTPKMTDNSFVYKKIADFKN